MNPPVAWAALNDDGDIAWIGYTHDAAADAACGRRIVPLYLHQQPALTDAEREAIERAIKTLDDWQRIGGYHELHDDDAATLRGLLERHKGVGE